MSTYTPQDLLDQINQIDFPELFAAVADSKERTAEIKLVRQKLKQVRQYSKEEQSIIKARWDGRRPNEAIQETNELGPYSMVDKYLDQIDNQIEELDLAVKFNRPLPSPPEILSYVIYDYKQDRIFLATEETAKLWLKKREEDQAKEDRLELERIKAIIQQGEYTRARQLLELFNHPTGNKWLLKVKQLEMQAAAKQRKKWRNRIILITLAIVLVGVIFIVNALVPRTMPDISDILDRPDSFYATRIAETEQASTQMPFAGSG